MFLVAHAAPRRRRRRLFWTGGAPALADHNRLDRWMDAEIDGTQSHVNFADKVECESSLD